MNNNNENSSIHQFDFSLICEYFSSINRQGPGSEESTLQALRLIRNQTKETELTDIADIGCGTGSSALALAQHTQAHITAIDLFPDFIEKLQLRAKELGVKNRLTPLVGSMEALPFQEEAFDVIWSEGAIYNIGFERGLQEWKRFIKERGYIAVTEASWLTEKRPAEIEQFWLEAYPEIDTITNNLTRMQRCGYRLVAAFVLPDECWTTNFYLPQREAQTLFLKKHAGNATAESLIQNQRHEAALYERYKVHYGYVFYIGQKL